MRRGADRRDVSWTLQRAFAGLVLLTVCVGALGTGGVLVAKTSIDQLVEQVTPAVAANGRALQHLTDAETAVRGYQLTGDREFLEPYHDGRSRYLAELRTVSRLVPDPGIRVALDRHERAAAFWLASYGDQVASGSRTSDSYTLVERRANKRAFDAVRAANADVDQRLQTVVTSLSARNERLAWQAVAAATGATLAALAIGVVVGLRTTRALVRPLQALQETVQRLTRGDHGARVPDVAAPTEVLQVAGALNALAEEAERLRAAEEEGYRLRRLAHEIGRELREHVEPGQLMEAAVLRVGAGLGLGRAVLAVGADRGTDGGLGAGTCAVWPEVREDERVGLDAVVRLVASYGHGALRDLHERADVVAVDDVRTEPGLGATELRRLDELGVSSYAAVPVGTGHELLGVLLVGHTAPHAWAADEVAALRSIAADVGRALVMARLYAQQERLVTELRALDQTKSDFLSTVSHELRTPLTSISGYVELIRDGDVGDVEPAMDGMLAVVERNVGRLRALIEDLLVLSRIESGANRLVVSDVDLAEVAVAAVETVRPSADKAGVDLGVDLGAEVVGTGCVVPGDRGQLDRVLLNLLANAVKFTPAGGRVRLGVRADLSGARVSVTDTGVGIPADELDRLFSRFFRASNVVAHAVQGTGLGLAIVRSIVEQHGGRVEVVSEQGMGTTFTVLLPRRPEALRPPEAGTPVGAGALQRTSGGRAG